MDDPARKFNVIDEAALTDLERALGEIESDSSITGVVVRSGKSGSFVAGADVHQIAGITDRRRVLEIIHRAHAVFTRLESLRAPTVAAIDGVCLGGGLELTSGDSTRPICLRTPRFLIELEQRAPQFKSLEGDPSPRHHINWP